MAFGEVAAVIGKKIGKEIVKEAGKVVKDVAIDAIQSGQRDAGWAGGTLVRSFAKEIGEKLDHGTEPHGETESEDGRDVPTELGEDRQQTDIPPELERPSDLEDVPIEIGEDVPQTDMPLELDFPSEPDGLSDKIGAKELDAAADERTDAPEKKGGSYKEVKESSEGDTHEVHHMPADSASPLERNDGPAIKMEREDHRQTASCGSSREAREYRERQHELIEQGKFREALQMDIDDIHDKFGDKYDDAISEMLEYVDKLEQEGKING